ncbi:hypothetical protein Hypma_009851 [Hypsizygus marmoreus]|uniref:Uncharacterized protein n=1 Tax=Hypsizygus marmoreus TaxID=39966 RepID=A0A369JP80_HYPMA|nr:hypothetical protein Hypma_009851 [Hypsizygus marmoreus]
MTLRNFPLQPILVLEHLIPSDTPPSVCCSKGKAKAGALSRRSSMEEIPDVDAPTRLPEVSLSSLSSEKPDSRNSFHRV